MLFLYILIGVLVGIILLLATVLFLLMKKGKFFTLKEVKFIIFVIDMYIEFGEELDIHSYSEHDKITKQLEKIKNKFRKYG